MLSSSRKCRKCKGRFALDMNNISSILFASTVDAFTSTFVRSLNTAIVEGPIERHKSQPGSRETGDGLSGTYSGGSLNRTKSVPRRSRERRARAGLREASRRDKAVRS